MRCSPLAIAYATDLGRLVDVSRQSSQITHADPRCTYGCAILNLTVAGILTDSDTPLQDALEYVIHSLQTALHDGLGSKSAEEAIVTAVNRGGDTDTIGAITGAIAGAQFGASQLPDRWFSAFDETGELKSLADELFEVV